MERMGRALTLARYGILLAVVTSLALGLALLVVVVGRGVGVVAEAPAAFTSAKVAKLMLVECIELADMILLAVALYIVALGLFELFIAPAPMPGWLVIDSLDDLKSKLINIIVVALGVTLFGQVATWDGVTSLLPLGAAIGAVIVALGVFGALRLRDSHGGHTNGRVSGADDAAER